MKNYYKISEISKLYGIGVDSIRYYERIGILKPHRDKNGYRLYNLKDMHKLNIIRDLRRLNFSMGQIKAYLDDQSLENTMNLLHQEQVLLKRQMQEIQNREAVLQERIASLQEAQEIETGIIRLKTIEERHCVQINEYITRDEEMDFLVKKLHRKHESKIQDFGNLVIGAVLSVDDLKRGSSNAYNSVFFILEEETADYDFIFPAGQYLSYFYRGGYEQNAERIGEMVSYAVRNGLTMESSPYELYEIDNRDTVRIEEFLTEIQIRVTKKQSYTK